MSVLETRNSGEIFQHINLQHDVLYDAAMATWKSSPKQRVEIVDLTEVHETFTHALRERHTDSVDNYFLYVAEHYAYAYIITNGEYLQGGNDYEAHDDIAGSIEGSSYYNSVKEIHDYLASMNSKVLDDTGLAIFNKITQNIVGEPDTYVLLNWHLAGGKFKLVFLYNNDSRYFPEDDSEYNELDDDNRNC